MLGIKGIVGVIFLFELGGVETWEVLHDRLVGAAEELDLGLVLLVDWGRVRRRGR